ncbi:HIT-like protein [Crepidotus variabilis]|uniref:HIT-like protein n=1 Tax=Crepidotus variabilis TaxID=179855 RepID=A0A9P6JVZ2_9AGAR|nr:HIT-like protein [Crepidotus variabilis]
MTSFIIKAHEKRARNTEWASNDDCVFCRILNNEKSSSVVYEDEQVIAFLDILPLRRGHTLVIPKVHIPRLSDLPPEYASALGMAVSKVAKALTQALDNTGLNVVCNQDYAQAVPHVHYHIIPAPLLNTWNITDPDPNAERKQQESKEPGSDTKKMHQMEFEARMGEMDVEDAEELAKLIRAKL